MQRDGETVCCKTVQYVRKLQTSPYHRLQSQLWKQTAANAGFCKSCRLMPRIIVERFETLV